MLAKRIILSLLGIPVFFFAYSDYLIGAIFGYAFYAWVIWGGHRFFERLSDRMSRRRHRRRR